jgi:hypothetical protein
MAIGQRKRRKKIKMVEERERTGCDDCSRGEVVAV